MVKADRRGFLLGSSAMAAGLSLGASALSALPVIGDDQLPVDTDMVRFRPEIEPLVRLIEETPRDNVIEKIVAEIKSGRSYRELLAALFLAGIRNVQPRPAVGFKFHCVLVVYATHQASQAAPDHQRWLPLLWAIDNFKGAQATDVREGNWTMAKVDEANLPAAEKSLDALSQALETWDIEAADRAAASAARTATRSQLLDVLARYASRDFRSIGHKAIYVAAAFRALDVIGWQHAEPIIRSLAYAILNHQGDENPSQHDYAVDQAGRANWELVKQWQTPWQTGKTSEAATLDVLTMLRASQPIPASQAVMQIIGAGTHTRAISDGLMLASAELVMRQPGIVPLHAVTTTNALTYLISSVGDQELRKWLLLQNVSFLSHFTEAAQARGNLVDGKIDQLVMEKSELAPSQLLIQSSDRSKNAQAIMSLAQEPAAAAQLIQSARELIFLKGTDAHDYKFSSAALEDYQLLSPKWRAPYLAGCSHLFKLGSDQDSRLAQSVKGF